MMNEGCFFTLVCEELGFTGGKVIHFDENVKNIEDVHKIVKENYQKHPNAKWELYPFNISNKK